MSPNNASGHRALRKGRYSEPFRPYLLTTATANRQPLFFDLVNARVVVNAIKHLHVSDQVESLAFVVMPDHLHWLCVPKEGVALPAIMHSLKSWTANQIKTISRYEGPVWQRAYHDRALRKDEDVLKVARYIVANPLRAGLVEKIGDYPHWDAKWLL